MQTFVKKNTQKNRKFSKRIIPQHLVQKYIEGMGGSREDESKEYTKKMPKSLAFCTKYLGIFPLVL